MIDIPETLLEKMRNLSQETGISIADLCRKLGIPSACLFISELNFDEMKNLHKSTIIMNSKQADELLKMIELSLKLRDEKTPIYDEFYSRIFNLVKTMNISLLSDMQHSNTDEIVATDKKFFVWLDMLGFKSLAHNCNTSVFHDKISKLIHSFDTAFDEARTIEGEIVSSSNPSRLKGTKVEDKIGLDLDFNFRMFSDAIIIWTNSTSYRVLSMLLDLIVKVMQKGFEIGMPFRGVLTYGDVFTVSQGSNFFLTNEAIYGNALIDAYTFEEKMDWAGVIVTEKAWDMIQKIYNDEASVLYTSEEQKKLGVKNLFMTKHILVNYPIPMKKDLWQFIIPRRTPKRIAINWNYDGRITDEMIKFAFAKGVKVNALPPKIRKKYKNTLSFWKYVNDQDHFKVFPDNS